MRVGISSSDWQDLEVKMQQNFSEGDNYQIQNVGGGKIMIEEATDKPAKDEKAGYVVAPEKWIGLTKENKKFWVKAITEDGSIINITKKED